MKVEMNLPSLKDIIGVDIKDILSRFNIIKIDRSVHQKVEVKEGGILCVNYNRLDINEKREFGDLIRKQAIPSNHTVIEAKAKEKTLGIKEGLPKSTDNELLEFYRTKLPPEYVDALEIAMVIRNKKQNDQQGVKELKRDVKSKYPKFGSNLCNLVSEGYFHTHFKELYESMSGEEDFEMKRYTEKIKQIVVSLPYTIFVNSYQTEEELSGFILYKLGKLQQYGTHRLLVHALNIENVKKAQDVINELETTHSVKVEYDPKRRGYMTAILRFENSAV